MYLSNTRFLPGQTLWKFGPIPNSFLFEAKFWARAQRNTSHGIWMYVWKLPQVSWANAAVEFNERLFSFSTPYTHSQIQGATFMLSSDSDHHGSSRFSTYPLSFPLLCYRAGSPSTLWTRWRTSCARRCPSSSPSYSSSCSTLGSSVVGVITGYILLSLQHMQNSDSPGTVVGLPLDPLVLHSCVQADHPGDLLQLFTYWAELSHSSFLAPWLPSAHDVRLMALALLRLQDVYNLPTCQVFLRVGWSLSGIVLRWQRVMWVQATQACSFLSSSPSFWPST